MRGILEVAGRPRPRSQAVLVGHNALERVVEYHGDQRIQVDKLNLTVPAPRDLDAEVNIRAFFDENKVEVSGFEDGLITEEEMNKGPPGLTDLPPSRSPLAGGSRVDGPPETRR